ncbi:MAG TPA: siderophore-interacting protein [Acidimicrobiales bacterium]|jgi:NADPH-dependent ferric siderophore reductase
MTSPSERVEPETVRRPDPRGSGLDSSTLLARLPDASLWQLTVRESVGLTPSMRRIRFGADDLAALSYEPGQDLMFSMPADGRTFRRRYTIRRVDRTADLLDVDMVLHGDGPGARWAAGAAPGDGIEAIGPRGKAALDPAAAWHLFVADESALPATFAMIEALGPGSTAIALIEVDGPAEEQPLAVPEGVDLSLRWLHRGGVPAGRSSVLADALAEVALPAGAGRAYLNGELKAVNGARTHLLGRGLGPDQILLKGYWRFGAANAAHGEPGRD